MPAHGGADAACALARRVVAGRYPDVHAAFLAGSAARGDGGVGSDLDVVVLRSPAGEVLRETLTGPVELFVHTEVSWRGFVEQETARRRSPLLHMCAEGVLLVDDGLGARLQAEARERWAAGPRPLTGTESEDLRYALGDLLGDLGSVVDPAEQLAVGARVLAATGELALLSRRQWIGTGKWMVRRWAEAAPAECAAVVAGVRALATDGSRRRLVEAARAVLDAAGGPVAAGYRRAAPT